MKNINKKGFVLVETIIVVSVLAIGLISLYSSYSLILTKTVNKSFYDNSEYIYKTYYIAKMIGNDENILTYDVAQTINNNGYDIIYKKDYVDSTKNNPVWDNLDVEKIYLTKKDLTSVVAASNILTFDGSTINYLRSLKDYTSGDTAYRIIVKFKKSGISQANFANIIVNFTIT